MKTSYRKYVVIGIVAFTCLLLLVASRLSLLGHVTLHNHMEGFHLLNSSKASTSLYKQKTAVEGLISRYLPGRESEFIVEINSTVGPDHLDTFELHTQADGRLRIRANTGVGAALGFGYFIKQFGNCTVAWSDVQLNLSYPLPSVPDGIHISSNDRFSYNSNVCTFGYTYVWWDWSRWQKEIDWMALNGINFPLAFVGQEAILQKVFLHLGVKQSDLDDWFTGPAFLPWFRMGNLIKWGGPLSQGYLHGQVKLQHQILTRMRDFGMLPVLPAFAGHVPAAVKQLYPEASITKLSLWSHFDGNYSGTYYLDPTDSLYAKIGHLFTSMYTKEFGTDHFYNIDPWNEMIPAERSVSYLSNASAAIMSSLRRHDPRAIWVMQGWMFVHNPHFWTKDRAKAFLTGVPQGEMIVLDLAAEYEPVYSKLNSFFGQPFIFCMINNYGGRNGLYGHMSNVNKYVFEARSYPNSTLIGTGLTMEGTGTNYMVYELMNEMHYRRESVDMYKWVGDYTTRRYGFGDIDLQQAWTSLLSTAYDCPDLGKELIVHRPSWHIKDTAFPGYNTSSLLASIQHIHNALQLTNVTALDSPLLRHDIIDIWREMLYVLLCNSYISLQSYVNMTSLDKFRQEQTVFLELIDDTEILMTSHHSYLLGNWVEAAQLLATSDSDKDLFRFNALNQLTLWGPNGEISDYAGKQWAGLIKHYYRERWSMFLQYNEKALNESTRFNQKSFEVDLLAEVEKPFGRSEQNFTTHPSGDTIQIVKDLYKKYRIYFDSPVIFNDL